MTQITLTIGKDTFTATADKTLITTQDGTLSQFGIEAPPNYNHEVLKPILAAMLIQLESIQQNRLEGTNSADE